ncbi:MULTISPECIES: hypothetical protein [Streptomyces]|uniref:hypothetical protein n=1 Tax=Streptomyces TaxID=1883 RepID=UPI00190F8D03|nr:MULTISPECIES: hypothetical protein [Streptomyces]
MTERPTTSGTEPHSVEELLDVLDEPIVPDGCKAGIIKGISSRRRGRGGTEQA